MKILGHDVEIRFEKSLRQERSDIGQSCGSSLWISVDPTLKASMQESTLIHEIIEQLNYHLEMKLEHPIISQLEASLYQVMKDNPDIFTIKIPQEDTAGCGKKAKGN